MNSRDSPDLKEILSEVGEELQGTPLWGNPRRPCWCPEYYEEGVENTPARILMTEVHGSGLILPQLLSGKGIPLSGV